MICLEMRCSLRFPIADPQVCHPLHSSVEQPTLSSPLLDWRGTAAPCFPPQVSIAKCRWKGCSSGNFCDFFISCFSGCENHRNMRIFKTIQLYWKEAIEDGHYNLSWRYQQSFIWKKMALKSIKNDSNTFVLSCNFLFYLIYYFYFIFCLVLNT